VKILVGKKDISKLRQEKSGESDHRENKIEK
jgi:hypothetical protein